MYFNKDIEDAILRNDIVHFDIIMRTYSIKGWRRITDITNTFSLKREYLTAIISLNRVDFIRYLHEEGYNWNTLDLYDSIKYNQLEIIDLIIGYNCPVSPYDLINVALYGDLDMFQYFYNKRRGIIDGATRTIRSNVMTIALLRSELPIILYLNSLNYKANVKIHDKIRKSTNKAKKEWVIQLLHSYDLVYDWGCINDDCLYCIEKKKDTVNKNWIMESEMYSSTIQWLPKEMIEETLLLL